MNATDRKARWAGVVLVLSALATARPARADETRDRAELLFREGVELSEKGRFDQACPKLEESQRLDPAPGTALDLAYCLERLGKLVAAEARYLDAERIATARNRPERVAQARGRLERLAPRIPRVRVVMPATGASAITARLDGVAVTPERPTVEDGQAFFEMAVDPGAHTIEVKTPSGATFVHRIEVAEMGRAVLLVPPAMFETPSPSVAEARRSEDRAPAAPPPANARVTPVWRTAAIVAGVSGLAFVAGGGVSGALAATHHAESERLCSPTCTPEALSSERTANDFAWGANIGLVAGGLLLGAAAVLWFASPKAAARPAAVVWPLRF